MSTYLLTWNPKYAGADGLDWLIRVVASVASKGTKQDQWSSGNNQNIAKGDRVFLLRQGLEFPGLVGAGHVTRGSYRNLHWDEDKAAKGVEANFIRVKWNSMVLPAQILSRDELLRHGIPESLLNAAASGFTIEAKIAARLEKLWTGHLKATPSANESSHGDFRSSLARSYVTRIAFNSKGWNRPTREAKNQEAKGTYNQENGFGLEDWLFRSDWRIAGWRYAFIQGVNRSRERLLKNATPFDLTLFTIDERKRRRYVATISDVECLDDKQADAALEIFKERGWYDTMREEIVEVGGRATAFVKDKRAKHILNVRYREANVIPFLPETYARLDDPVLKLNRYTLSGIGADYSEATGGSNRHRQGDNKPPNTQHYWRRASEAVQCTPEHAMMQTKLLSELKKEYPRDTVIREENFVDLKVQTEKELILFEIKTDLAPRTVIREALGQILEYGFYRTPSHSLITRLVIVGRQRPSPKDEAYLNRLKRDFGLPLSYRTVPI